MRTTNPAARHGGTSSAKNSRRPLRQSGITIPLAAAPLAWRRKAKDQGFASVEEWAASTLEHASWPGSQMVITMTDGQLEEWGKAAIAARMNLRDWLEAALERAAAAPVESGLPANPSAGGAE